MSSPARTEKIRRAVLGGSFDPVHLGHLELARVAKDSAGLEGVLFMPCHVSPFKQGTVANSDQRFEMLRLALEEVDLSWAAISTYEIDRPQPSFSWETAHHLTAVHPEVDWHWIVGTDQWEEIDRWAEPEKLRELLHFVVVTRDGQSVQHWKGWRYTAVPFSHPASSTAIRGDLTGHRDWLCESVFRFCRENDLYGGEESFCE